MLLADTLSRYASLMAHEIELDIAICHIHLGSTWKSSLQELTRTDPLLRSLTETIINGWPEDPKDIPEALRSYWNQRHVMTVEDGIILHGEAVLIPIADRRKMLQLIHEGHMGITKCRLHTKNCIYWPGINKDIQCMVEGCETCQRFILVSLMPHSRLWSHLQDHGRESDQTFLNSMDMTILSLLTTTPTYRSYIRYHMDNVTQQRSSHSQRKSSQNTEYLKCSCLIMDQNIAHQALLNLLTTGNSLN